MRLCYVVQVCCATVPLTDYSVHHQGPDSSTKVDSPQLTSYNASDSEYIHTPYHAVTYISCSDPGYFTERIVHDAAEISNLLLSPPTL